jgi:hypothetical protein
LKELGFEMYEPTYFRQNKNQDMKLERMHQIAKYSDQHLERIDRCELIEKLCWENYHQCKDPTKEVKILRILKMKNTFSLLIFSEYLRDSAFRLVAENKDLISQNRMHHLE